MSTSRTGPSTTTVFATAETQPPNYIENGVLLTLSQVEQVSELLAGEEKALLLTVVYSNSCALCAPLLQKLEEAIDILNPIFRSLSESNLLDEPVVPPMIAKLDGSKVDSSWLEQLGLTLYPTLLFFQQSNGETSATGYMGLSDDTTDIVDTILHHWYRNSVGPIVPKTSLDDVRYLVRRKGHEMLSHVTPALNPDYTDEERDIIHWIMEFDHDPDPYVLFIQCRTMEDHESYQQFEDLGGIILTQRDVMLFTISVCDTNGEIISVAVDPRSMEFEDNIVRSPSNMSAMDFAVIRSTPSVLFYDRVSTGPIAFPAYRKVHAVLFVKLGGVARDASSQSAVRALRKVCQEQRKQRREDDMVCLIVPETETRILNYFGVDIWTPMDVLVSEGKAVEETLPLLLITDQREQRFVRYYLDAKEIINDELAIQHFIHDFWNKRLTPEIKSSVRESRMNKHGVEIITGQSFRSAVLEKTDKHTLLYLYAPTCGHCKRFSILWNELGRILKSVKWNMFLDLKMLDVTDNEVVDSSVNINPAFVPALYYFPLGDSKESEFVQYNVRDPLYGNSVGSMRDAMQILDWMLDVGSFDEVELLKLANELAKADTEKARGRK